MQILCHTILAIRVKVQNQTEEDFKKMLLDHALSLYGKSEESLYLLEGCKGKESRPPHIHASHDCL